MGLPALPLALAFLILNMTGLLGIIMRSSEKLLEDLKPEVEELFSSSTGANMTKQQRISRLERVIASHMSPLQYQEKKPAIRKGLATILDSVEADQVAALDTEEKRILYVKKNVSKRSAA